MEDNAAEATASNSNNLSQARKPLFSLGRRVAGKENVKSSLRDATESPGSPGTQRLKDKKPKKKLQNPLSAGGKKSPMSMRNAGEEPPIIAPDDFAQQDSGSKATRKSGFRRYAGKTLFGAIDLIRSPSASPHLRAPSPYMRSTNAASRSFTTPMVPSLVGNGLFMTHESPPESINDTNSLLNFAKGHIFWFRELNAMLEPVRNIEFSFDITSQNLMFRAIDKESEGPFEVYDSYRKVLLMDTGLLIVFQIQSSARGIKVLEATLDREKQFFFQVIQSCRSMYSPFLVTSDPRAGDLPDQTTTATIPKTPSVSSLHADKEEDDRLAEVYGGIPPDSVPLFFIRRWRQTINNLLSSRMILVDHDTEADRVINHLGFLKTNIEALEEDLLYFKTQSEQRKAEIARTNQDSTRIQKKLDDIRTIVTEKRQIVLQDELPKRMTDLAGKIKLLQRRESTKFLRVLFVSSIIVILLLFICVWLFNIK